MNSIALSQFGYILAAHARVLGMEAENKHREACGDSPAYVSEHFEAEAAQIENCAREIANYGG